MSLWPRNVPRCQAARQRCSHGPAAHGHNASRTKAIFLLAGLALALAGCGQQQEDAQVQTGHEIFLERCALCHNVNAQGIPGKYPPLIGSDWVNGPPERLAAIILDGVRGPLGNLNGLMPGWRSVLPDTQIAAVMNWLKEGTGKPAVTAVEVNHVRLETGGRNTFWTVGDLRNLRVR